MLQLNQIWVEVMLDLSFECLEILLELFVLLDQLLLVVHLRPGVLVAEPSHVARQSSALRGLVDCDGREHLVGLSLRLSFNLVLLDKVSDMRQKAS